MTIRENEKDPRINHLNGCPDSDYQLLESNPEALR